MYLGKNLQHRGRAQVHRGHQAEAQIHHHDVSARKNPNESVSIENPEAEIELALVVVVEAEVVTKSHTQAAEGVANEKKTIFVLYDWK